MNANISNNTLSLTRSLALGMWMIASLFYAYQYILRVMPSIMMSDITHQFNIDSATYGQFSGIYYIGYALMHLPIGILLDRFGPKKILPLCMILTVLGLLPLLYSDYWGTLILGRALIGMGSSAAILGTFKIIRLTFEEQKFTRMLSFSVTIGLIGAIYGGGPVAYLTSHWGYQSVIMLFIGLGVALCLLTYLLVPETPKTSQSKIIADIKEVFSSKKVIGICVLSGLMVGPLEGFADVWGSEFLKRIYGLEGTQAASLPSIIFMGMCFGPILSLIAEKTNYLATIVGAGCVMIASFFAILTGTLSIPFLTVIFFMVGVCCAYQILSIYYASTFVSERVTGLTTAVANMIIMTFGYFFHALIGWMINYFGGIESNTAFLYGIAIIPVALIIGVVGLIMLATRRNIAKKIMT